MSSGQPKDIEQSEEDKDMKACQEMFDRFISAGRVVGKTYTPELHFEQWTAFNAGWWAAKNKVASSE